jgi:hypothetical protein
MNGGETLFARFAHGDAAGKIGNVSPE